MLGAPTTTKDASAELRAAATRLAEHFTKDEAASAPPVEQDKDAWCAWIAERTTAKELNETLTMNDLSRAQPSKQIKVRCLLDYGVAQGV